ncbi:MAG TPA: hypothetical protein VJU13_10220 [Candidatus Nitrosocosmicus sp.]|jgi:hypothetical protein|nr:hypothetical protein [Candidatus Nitrosocosmicus sp.]
MSNIQENKSCPKNLLTNPQILKGGLTIFFIYITFNVIGLSYHNPVEAQTMMYKCSPDMGVNVSMVNCLTNSTSDKYNSSMVSEMRQNATK